MPETIVCGVTGAPESIDAAELAAELGEQLGLSLVLAHAVDLPPAVEESLSARHQQQGAARLLKDVARSLDVGSVSTRVELGDPAEALARIAAEERAALVVLGARPAGLRRRDLRCRLATRLAATGAVPVVVAASRPRSREAPAPATAATAV